MYYKNEFLFLESGVKIDTAKNVEKIGDYDLKKNSCI